MNYHRYFRETNDALSSEINDLNLQYVKYYDSAFDYTGYGVLVSDKEGDIVQVTHIFGAVLLLRFTSHQLEDMPSYPVVEPYGYAERINGCPFPIPSWVLDFDVSHLGASEIHHIGLFFEWFMHGQGSLTKRLESALQYSNLPIVLHKELVLHIVSAIGTKEDQEQMQHSKVIQSLSTW